MPANETELNTALDRQHVIPVQVSANAPLPSDNASYDPIRHLEQNGLRITTRELLHAIGTKTAALPSSAVDECLRASLLYTYVLDLDRPNLCFKTGKDSDLQTNRSHEVGIGMMCLLVNKAFGVLWDQLGSLPGRGLRFDYRGQVDGFDGIFESKGTSYRSNQSAQIKHGLDKKDAHHNRGDRFDVELIISTFVGRGTQEPRIIVGDPDFSVLEKIYEKADNRFFRLRHYVRILQFVGLPKSAFALNRYALSYYKGERRVGDTILSEKQVDGYLVTEHFGGRRYFGRWFEDVAPKDSPRYREDRYSKKETYRFDMDKKRKVFQGIREDVYFAGFEKEPFTHDLLTQQEIHAEMEKIDVPVSLFPDGTVQVFRQERAEQS